MALNLHPDCKARLKEKLEEQLSTVEVQNKCYLVSKSTAGFFRAGDPLPKHGPCAENLQSFLGEDPFFGFLYGYISKELQEQQDFDSDAPICKLVDLEQYSNIFETADRLVELFDSLPWQYKFTIEFNSFLSTTFSELPGRIEISKNVSLVKSDDRFIEEYSLRSGIRGRDRCLFEKGFMGLNPPKELNRESVYLQTSTNGFVGKDDITQTAENILSIFKSFCGLSIALQLLKIKDSYQHVSPRIQFFIHRNIGDTWIIDETQELPDNLSRTVSELVFNDLGGTLDDAAKKWAWMLRCIPQLKKAFGNNDQTEKLMLAGQWLFDSYSGRNELLSFVQTMVALEILLGDKASSDVLGLGELLRNRCAYLIGKDHAQREQVLKDFKDIYDIRSRIVHRGKSRLTYRERVLFDQLRWICQRVIQKEIELIT